MRKFGLLAAASVIVLAASCSRNEPSYLSDPDAVRIDAVVGPLTRSNPVGTPEEQTVFNEGDKIAISNGGEYVTYVLNNGSWLPEETSKYLKWESSSMTFRAFYPSNNYNLFESGFLFPNQGDDESYVALCDFMTAEVTADKSLTGNVLNLTMERRTARVVVKIDSFRDEFDGTNPVVSEVKVYSETNVPYEKPYRPRAFESFNKDGLFYVLVCPSEAWPDQTFIELTVEYGTYPDRQSKTLTVKGVPAMEAGKSYTYSIIVGKTTVKVGNVTVKDWMSGAAIDDGMTESIAAWSGNTEAFADSDAYGNSLGLFESEPILIKNAEQLAYLAEQVKEGNGYSGRYFKLADDINLAEKPWTPIGVSTAFRGKFDGDGKRVFGLKVEGSFQAAGLFGFIADGSIKNVVVESADIAVSSSDAAVLCGLAQAAAIENCYVRGDMESTGSRIGGLVGTLTYSSTIKGCMAEVTVKGDAFVGGICGEVYGSTISGCSLVNSSVEGTDDWVGGVGGIAGKLDEKNTVVENCGFSGTVKGVKYVGGLIGRLMQYASPVKVSDCSVYADVLSAGIGGGLVGCLNKTQYSSGKAEFSKCGFDGTVTNIGTGSVELGAALGLDESAATFTDCWYNADKTDDLPAVWSSEEDAVGKDYSGIEAKKLGK